MDAQDLKGATLFLFGLMLSVCTAVNSQSAEQKVVSTNTPIVKPVTVRTNFSADAQLTKSEIAEVLALAKACGIAQPEEIRTFHYIPGGGKGIAVKSVERVNGRDVEFDELTVGKTGWKDMGPGSKVKTAATFWSDPERKFTRRERVCSFRGKEIRVSLSEGVTGQAADEIVGLVSERKVRMSAKNELVRFEHTEIEKMLDAKPTMLEMQNGGLLLHVDGTLNALDLRVENGEVVVEGLVHIRI